MGAILDMEATPGRWLETANENTKTNTKENTNTNTITNMEASLKRSSDTKWEKASSQGVTLKLQTLAMSKSLHRDSF